MRFIVTLLAWAMMLATAAAAETTVCVNVKRVPEESIKTPQGWSKPVVDESLPIGQDPLSYLKRLIEYFVTHERGYVAVEEGCQEHIDLELYPLKQGWTVFARYSANGREERVDTLGADELSQFAERAVTALLYDKPISTTILRDTVLRADSKRAIQRIAAPTTSCSRSARRCGSATASRRCITRSTPAATISRR
jgi:hypothetical protein